MLEASEDSPFRVTLITLYEQEKLPKYLAQVSAIDLVDDEHVSSTRVGFSSPTKLNELPSAKLETAAGWPIALDKVFVGVRLVKLNVRKSLRILCTHPSKGEPLRRE